MSEQMMAEMLEKLRESGVKLTHQRMEIFREIAGRTDHPDAATIYECVRKRLPTVSLDTVYRTLSMLKEAGLISTLGPNQDRLRFDANIAPHHHFVCTKCGKTEDFYCEEFNALRVPSDVLNMGIVEHSHVELRGICSECRRSN
ncbi:MAG: transcriptional repressor [Calditrichaeota bacterium]|nr:transcriptional repressor [Calditrichota bacterium]